MNRELRQALEDWNGDPSIRQEWDTITGSRAFRAALHLERLKVMANLESVGVDKHSQVVDRTVYALQGGLKALSKLENLTNPAPEKPQPLPEPWAYAATEVLQPTANQ